MRRERSPQSFAEKSRLLLQQAELDLSHGCFEKSASASYFAVENALNALSLGRQGSLPKGYRSRLALMGRWFPEEATEFDRMHRVRVKADHWDDLIPEEDARKQLESAKKLVEKLLSLLSE